MVVIYAEKSSLAKEIAKALGAGQRHSLKDEPTVGYYEFEWNGENAVICHGVGHLAQLLPAKAYDEKYAKWDLSVFPCIPDTYKIAAKAQTKACMSLVKSFFDKADWLVNATDPDREGELIFSYVKEVCKCSAPVKRVWIEDLTAQKIQYAFDHLKAPDEPLSPTEKATAQNLELAARARGIADWVIGSNLTVATTVCRASSKQCVHPDRAAPAGRWSRWRSRSGGGLFDTASAPAPDTQTTCRCRPLLPRQADVSMQSLLRLPLPFRPDRNGAPVRFGQRFQKNPKPSI